MLVTTTVCFACKPNHRDAIDYERLSRLARTTVESGESTMMVRDTELTGVASTRRRGRERQRARRRGPGEISSKNVTTPR
jgi:hypothetical protein